MTPADVLAFCLSLPGAWEDEPWEGDVVTKVGSKIFVFVGDGTSVGVKCGTRAVADEWLHRYPDDARASAYIGRHGWNALTVGGAIPDDEIRDAIRTSYGLVVAGLPRRERPSPS